jgi:hypothetical protein
MMAKESLSNAAAAETRSNDRVPLDPSRSKHSCAFKPIASFGFISRTASIQDHVYRPYRNMCIEACLGGCYWSKRTVGPWAVTACFGTQ